MPPSTDVIQGTLDMLILKSLSLEPMHGFGITKRIEQISKGVFRVKPGSLLLAFQRMERDGVIDAEWRASENNRRAKYYRLTDKGRKRLRADSGQLFLGSRFSSVGCADDCHQAARTVGCLAASTSISTSIS